MLSNHVMAPTPVYRSNPIVPTDTWNIGSPSGYYDADVTLWDGSSGSSTLNSAVGSVTGGVESTDYRPAGDVYHAVAAELPEVRRQYARRLVRPPHPNDRGK